MKIVDLRSDTVTLPTPAMREAMYRAEVGDDVFGEDPTINRLEEIAAARMGKESALFVVSGTMANLVSLLTHCGRGDEVIMGQMSHTFNFEVGASSALGGVHVRTVPNQPNGSLDPQDVEEAIRGDNIHYPRTRLICLENTHNLCGGAVLSLEQIDTIGDVAAKHGLAVHLDGARIFNAAIFLGVDPKELTRSVNSVAFCFSKGLAAPVGSAICGERDFIREARRHRKMVGGGMRQAGILAAAAIVALEQMVDRLADDHRHARRLAEGINEIDGLRVDLARVQTNMVLLEITDQRMTPAQLVARLDEEGVKLLSRGGGFFRAVTHYGIEKEDIDLALAVMRRVMGERG
jgi:threonine aldolase